MSRSTSSEKALIDNIVGNILSADVDQLGDIESEITLLNRDRKINLETLTTDKSLDYNDFCYQHYITESNVEVILPPNPDPHQKFAFLNKDTSTATLVINGETLDPGDSYEIIWDGDKWEVI